MSSFPGNISDASWQKVLDMLAFVVKSQFSDFYRKKYQEAGFDVGGIRLPKDFYKIPFLTRDELVVTKPFDRCYFEKDSPMHLLSSSGTSLRPPVLTLMKSVNMLSPKDGMSSSGDSIPYGSRVLILKPAVDVALLSDANKHLNLTIVAGLHDNPSGNVFLARSANINVIVASPDTALSFGEVLGKNYNLANIVNIRLRGGEITESAMERLRIIYPKARIFSTYGLNESGFAGIICPSWLHGGIVYHGMEKRFMYERAEDANELILTHLDPGITGTPLIRYRTGDAVEFVNEKCGCGNERPGQIFRIDGRIQQDIYRVGGFDIFADNFKRILAEEKWVENFRLDVKSVHGEALKPALTLFLATYNAPHDLSYIKKRFLEELQVSHGMMLADAIASGRISGFDISVVKPGQKSSAF